MTISIIIVNYNTFDLIKDCISSIYKYCAQNAIELIIVDNNSPDRNIEKVTDFYPDVKLVQNKINNGFGTANNLGATFAKGEYLFFLNPDTIFLNNALKYFIRFVQNEKLRVGAVGSILLSEDLTVNASYSKNFTSYLEDVFSGILNKFLKRNTKSNDFLKESYMKVSWVSGADLFLKKSVFNEIGGFDENFFMYYEENDLQRRILQQGYNNYVIDGPKIIHFEGGGVSKISLDKKRIIDTSKFYYYKKYSSALEFWIVSKIYRYLTFISLWKEYNFKEARRYCSFIKQHT